MKKWTVIVLIFTAGCADFFDSLPSNSDQEQSFYRYEAKTLGTALQGCYNQLIRPEYYGRNYRIMFDIYTGNAKLNYTNSNRFTAFNNRNIESKNEYITEFWLSCYKTINLCNKIIRTTNTKDNTNDSITIYNIRAQALTIRSLAYFDLAKTFAQHYSSTANAEEQLGIPIIDENNIDTIVQPYRQSIKDTYEFILDNLKEACLLIETNTYNSETITKQYIWGLIAKVSLQKEDYVTTIKYCDSIIQSNNYSLLSPETYLDERNNTNNPENIFYLTTKNNTNGTESLDYLLSENGYADAIATEDLTVLFSENDVRKEWINANTPHYISKFSTNNQEHENICLLSYTEVLLMAAEACTSLILSGNVKEEFMPAFEQNAQNFLNMVKKRTSTAFVPTNSTYETLLNEILIEKRKEFCFEGHLLSDIKRNKRDIDIKDCNNTICSFAFNSPKLTMPIPIEEINANKNIIQNISY